MNLVSEISKHTFEKAFLVFSKDPGKEEEFKKFIIEALSIFDKETAGRIILVQGTLEELNRTISEELEKA